MSTEMPQGKTEALNALTEALESVPIEKRISATTTRKIVDVAWRHQFTRLGPDRAAARRDLLDDLQTEFLRAKEAGKE